MCEINSEDLHLLLQIFEKKAYEAGSGEEGSEEYEITKKCESLFKLDYSVLFVDNNNGVLSPRYPGKIFIPEYEHGNISTTITAKNSNLYSPHNNSSNSYSNSLSAEDGLHAYVFPKAQQQHLPQQQKLQSVHNSPIYEELYDVAKIRELITMAKYARCRQRFAVPVIMFRGKYICRSATISVDIETYGRKVVDYAYDCLSGTNPERSLQDYPNSDTTDESLMNHINDHSSFSYDEAIKSDIQLLGALKVSTIVDLMVEKRKIKYFMAVSSSEKADPENHYQNFNLYALPYPGCEFFRNFRDNNYMAKNLHYNWNQSFNDANICIPKLGLDDIYWNDYKRWDLVVITQNYLKALLKCLQDSNSGLLVHCISGWDRTPLFISLIRLSLWADGFIHQSLSALQITYLTLAYDWYLFGHQLPDRLKRGEDIMFFCFHVLKYITDDDFSLIEHRKRTKTSSSSGSSVVVIKSDDEEPLKEDYVLHFDQDSNDSNCDISITDNFYSPNNTNGLTPSPNPKRSRTSPIPISVPSRQRHESTSSNGSWQVVTDTGSLESMINGSFMLRGVGGMPIFPDNFSLNSMNFNPSTVPMNRQNLNGSGNSNMGEEIHRADRKTHSLRKQRLNAVRALFIQTYGKTIGLKFKESMNLATFIGTLTDQLF